MKMTLYNCQWGDVAKLCTVSIGASSESEILVPMSSIIDKLLFLLSLSSIHHKYSNRDEIVWYRNIIWGTANFVFFFCKHSSEKKVKRRNRHEKNAA
jgi:hypothetical protein